MYQQYNNGNPPTSQPIDEDQYWQSPRPVTMIKYTKVKPNRDGTGIQRGVLIRDDAGAERWVSEHPDNAVFKLSWNNRIH